MDNTREKLIDILSTAHESYYSKFDPSKTYMDVMADHLIANGVMVQKWIPLSEQKPDRDTLVIVFFEGMRGTPAETQIMYGWCIGGSASHWMPLPEPPKEVG